MSVAARVTPCSLSTGAFPLVVGSFRFDLTVEGKHRPVVPMSVRLCGHFVGRVTAVPCRNSHTGSELMFSAVITLPSGTR